MDEADALTRKRSAKEGEASRRVKTQLLRELSDEDPSAEDSGQTMIVLAATNCPQEVSKAVLA